MSSRGRGDAPVPSSRGSDAAATGAPGGVDAGASVGGTAAEAATGADGAAVPPGWGPPGRPSAGSEGNPSLSRNSASRLRSCSVSPWVLRFSLRERSSRMAARVSDICAASVPGNPRVTKATLRRLATLLKP
jgi:hypothetical protein